MTNVRIRLDRILFDRKIKQNVLAEQTGLSPNTISGLATNGATMIRLSTLAKVCEALDIQPGDLFELNTNGK